MNANQLARRRRFAAMHRKQLERAARRFQPDRADVEVGKTPGGPAWGDASRNQRQMFVDHASRMGGIYHLEHWRDGKLINKHLLTEGSPNGITNEGLNNNLSVYFDAGTQRTAWYMSLIDLTGYTALAATDTYDDINQAGNGWDEFSSYTDANNASSATTRPEWPPDTPSGQSISNTTTKSIFDITASGTVKGIFVCGGTQAQTKGDHTAGNTLWSTALFSGGDVAVSNGDQLKVTYTVNASTT